MDGQLNCLRCLGNARRGREVTSGYKAQGPTMKNQMRKYRIHRRLDAQKCFSGASDVAVAVPWSVDSKPVVYARIWFVHRHQLLSIRVPGIYPLVAEGSLIYNVLYSIYINIE